MVAEGEGEKRISTVGDSVTVGHTKLQIHELLIYLKCTPNNMWVERCWSSFSTHVVQAQGWLRLQGIARRI